MRECRELVEIKEVSMLVESDSKDNLGETAQIHASGSLNRGNYEI
jgi:hypothetical protein